MLTLAPLPEKPVMSFSLFLATEGGRKCPMCGKYAKSAELGWIGHRYYEPIAYSIATREPSHFVCTGIVDAYGHKEGFGCNKPKD